jgi:RHS repeat-associated protein
VTSNFLADALGSPVAVTDNAGVVQTEYTYEPFGKTTVSGASNSNSYQYTGRENDGTGLYYYRARYYNPQLQRFISEDPIGLKSRDVNFYAYVRNSPVLFTDPTGEFWGQVIVAVVRSVLGIGTGTAIIDGIQPGQQCFGGCPAHAPTKPTDIPPKTKSDNSAGDGDQCSGDFCWPDL